ncbi:AraC family transcriptional regulator [Christiangramia sp.]|uniref:AraC family transcriptional regulator n=1 Tax=Christiangramia sp. TaxID=1931228 RepID=UPI0026355C4D|nr:helix-turn-helix domain-containing protein [Christiangramia sp.]
MHSAKSPGRVQEILNFITEITLGNYTYTLPLRNQKTELEQIVLSLNTMVEEIDTAVHQINLEKSKEVIENIVFNLDRNLHIISYSDNVGAILNYSKDDLINKPVKLALSEETKLPEDLFDLLKHAIEKNLSFKVEFRHQSGYLWSGDGYLHQMVANGKKTYTLSVFKAVYQNDKLKKDSKNQKPGTQKYPSEYRSLLLRDQRALVRKLHKYVMQRLDRKLQKLPVIAGEVGGSVSKIKVIFKRAYGDTIYAFHLRKRLEKAYTLIKSSSTPINEIAEECGFKSFSHFSRSFKKEHGMTPSQARKF